jgi:hypothetical protein
MIEPKVSQTGHAADPPLQLTRNREMATDWQMSLFQLRMPLGYDWPTLADAGLAQVWVAYRLDTLRRFAAASGVPIE